MKKILFLIIISAAAGRVSAQRQLFAKPNDSLSSKLLPPFYLVKPGDSSLYKKYFNMPGLKSPAQLNALSKPGNAEIFYSTMPVVKIGSRDKMPVIKPGDSNNYTMLIKKVKVVNPLLKQQPVTP